MRLFACTNSSQARIGSATGANDGVSRLASHGLTAGPAAAQIFALLTHARARGNRPDANSLKQIRLTLARYKCFRTVRRVGLGPWIGLATSAIDAVSRTESHGPVTVFLTSRRALRVADLSMQRPPPICFGLLQQKEEISDCNEFSAVPSLKNERCAL